MNAYMNENPCKYLNKISFQHNRHTIIDEKYIQLRFHFIPRWTQHLGTANSFSINSNNALHTCSKPARSSQTLQLFEKLQPLHCNTLHRQHVSQNIFLTAFIFQGARYVEFKFKLELPISRKQLLHVFGVIHKRLDASNPMLIPNSSRFLHCFLPYTFSLCSVFCGFYS